jgi:hypothetical protein
LNRTVAVQSINSSNCQYENESRLRSKTATICVQSGTGGALNVAESDVAKVTTARGDPTKSTPARGLRQTANRLAKSLLERARAGAIPPRPSRSPARKVFVVGCPRSGTTWVRDILAHHPMTIAGRESHIYDDLYAPLVRLGRTDRAWKRILHRDLENRERGTGGHIHAWLDRETFHGLVVRAMADDAASDVDAADTFITEIYDQILSNRAATAAHILIDKTPWHVRYGEVILRQFPDDARIVEVVRDGRDVCVSMQMLEHDWVVKDRRLQISRWADAIRYGIDLRGRFPDRVLSVHYEDLKDDVRAGARRLFDFVQLPYDDAFVDGLAAAVDISSAANTGDGAFRRAGRVGDWRDVFSPEDERLFRTIVGDLFTLAGYEY